MDNYRAFELLCGNCAGVDTGAISKQDIVKQATYFLSINEIESETEMQALIDLACDYIGLE